MLTIFRNLRYGMRLLRKSPGFTIVAVATLALGVGANTAIFSVLYATLFAPLPYPHPDQLVVVWSKVDTNRVPTSAPDFQDWLTQNKSFQMLGIGDAMDYNLATSATPQVVHGARLSAGYLDKMIGETPWLGRYVLPGEDQPGKDHVAILTHSLWERLGANPNIIGQNLRMNGEIYTVIGVRPPGYADRLPSDVVVPLVLMPEQFRRDNHFLTVLGRLKPGVSIAQAQADMEVIAKRIAQDHPDSNKGWGVKIELLHNDFLEPNVRKNLWLLMGAVGFLLLIACVNVANLLLARGSARQKEIAVRTSLGATRARMFMQFMAESMTLSLVGGALGIGLGVTLVKIVVALLPPFALPSEADVKISLPVLLFTFAVTTFAGILFGCAPAWQASEINPNETLKEGGRTGMGAGRHRLRKTLVVVEFSLALTLLAAAGLAIHSFWNLTQVDLGVRTDHVLTFSLRPSMEHFAKPEQITAFYRQVQEKVKSIPGVSFAEIATGLPLEGTYFGRRFNIVGGTQDASRLGAGFQMVTPDYFQASGIRITRGRSFTAQDTAKNVRVAMVSEAFVRSFLRNADPLQQRLMVSPITLGVGPPGPQVEWQIVGVFSDAHNNGIHGESYPEIDVPFWQDPWPQVSMVVRTVDKPDELSKSIATAVTSVDPDLPLADVRTMDEVVNRSLAGDRFMSVVYGGFAALALLLSAVGIYGVMAFAVAQRTHEIGLRMALGAAREQVLQLVLKEGIVLALVGLGLGFLGAILVGRMMQGMLYGVGSLDFAAFTAVAGVLLATALLACYVPARRAAKVDPIVALRYE